MIGQACIARLGIRFPAVVDSFDNLTERTYTEWPDRLYVIDKKGRIAFKSRPGPYGFHARNVVSFRQACVGAKARGWPARRKMEGSANNPLF